MVRQAHATILELAGEAAAYSAFTSSGFLVSVVLAWVILNRLPAGFRAVGGFGKFMILLEAVGALPEAMVIAEATAAGRMNLSFAFSIFTLNIANTLAMALDYLATNPDRRLHRLMVIFIFFSVGSLMYSVDSTVFSEFLINLSNGTYSFLHLLPMLGGVGLGTVLIWVLMALEERAHARQHAKDEAKTAALTGAAAAEAASSNATVLEPIRLALQREEAHLEAVLESSHPSEEYHNQVVNRCNQRIKRIKDLIDSFESAQTLTRTSSLFVAQDAQEVINDNFYSEAGAMEHSYLLDAARPTSSTLHRRALKLMAIVIGLTALSVILTFACTPVFAVLDEGNSPASSYLNAFAEGLSGGAFLATVSSTMIPRIQQDAYRSAWSRFTFRSIGMVSFVFGLVFSVLLDLFNVRTDSVVLANSTALLMF